MSLTEYRVGDKTIWNQGRIYEQARIIKLLEQTLGYGDEDWDADVMACIALIKGEK